MRQLWKKANKKYAQKQKDGLTDIYIKSLLRGKEITPKTIEAKRQELIAKKINQMNQKV